MPERTVTDETIRELLSWTPTVAAVEQKRSMRILFLVSAHNGLSQRAWIALTELGHRVTVAVVDSAASMEAAVCTHDPELILCPFLKTRIPERIWRTYDCLVVHPGPQGDRGPSSLDWAIELGMTDWGVTVLLADGVFDAGDVLATRTFPMREAGKTSIYRHEVRRAAIETLLEGVEEIINGSRRHRRPGARPAVSSRPLMTQDVRAIDWRENRTESVLRKIRAGEGHPGVLDTIGGQAFHLFGGHREHVLHGRPGELIANRDDAICRATTDGAVWITHLKRPDTPTQRYFKLPATVALELADVELELAESTVPFDARISADQTYREIAYEEDGDVGYLRFEFYNGAMSTEHCERLRAAYALARSRDTKVIVLAGGIDYFSNGIHLNLIEAAEDPASESWRNLNAIDDLVRDIIETDSHLVVSALAGDAAAGGVPLALAADYVIAREDVVLNPYYRHMGGLYGSEYWTYLLPRRIGATMATCLTNPPFDPVGARQALSIRLVDAVVGASLEEFRARVRAFATRIARDGLHRARLQDKHRRRAHDEHLKPLQAYRTEELNQCLHCFFGVDPAYHDARRRFVYKTRAPQESLRRVA